MDMKRSSGTTRRGSSAEIKVRNLETADRRRWEDLWADYNAFYGRKGETALEPAIVDATWTRLLDDTEPVHGLLALKDNIPVGLAHVVLHPNLIQRELTCYMQDLYTCTEARGTGVARRLIEAVCDHCLAEGVADVYWHTHESNEVARRLYDRVARNTGFLVYRIKPLSSEDGA
jgi:GNAT superfamily N-acetyltransferase